MPSIYSQFDQYDEEKVRRAYLNRHYRGAFVTEEEMEFLKKPATPEREDKARQIHERITERMMDNVDKLRIARCPECERILESPRARQCLWCKNKFHDKPRPPRQVYRRIEMEVVEKEDAEEEEVPRITKVRVRTELRGKENDETPGR